MNNKRLQKYILKIKDSFLNETEENKKMMDIYLKYAEGNASEEEIIEANKQFEQILKSLGLGVLVVLPFSPITIPYIIKKAKEFGIDIIPNWYKKL